jgi:ABC-type glutathione transport system ATPase component
MSALLEVQDLVVAYARGRSRRRVTEILHGVSFEIRRGETLGLVGESGSGKTTIGRAVLGLAEPKSGTIKFGGRDITHLAPKRRRGLAQELQVVFQDPYSSLNPGMTIADILSEPLIAEGATRLDARSRIKDLLDRVGLPSGAGERLPREFSGGQRQRVAIARALAVEPQLIVCDEPVSALDLSTQARILELLVELQRETGVAYLFISHDLAVVRHISHRVSVLYRGEIVETGPAATVTKTPTHPYTRRLLMSAPVADPAAQRARRLALEHEKALGQTW